MNNSLLRQDVLSFLKIANCQSLSEASIVLGVGQPQISKRVKALEDELGFKLFIRRPRGIVLSRQGSQFLNFVQKARGFLDREFSAATQPRRALRIAGHEIILERCLPLFIGKLQKTAHPAFQLEACSSAQAVQKVVAGEMDLAFAVDPIPRPSLVMKPLFQDMLGVWRGKGDGSVSKRRVFYHPQTQRVAR